MKLKTPPEGTESSVRSWIITVLFFFFVIFLVCVLFSRGASANDCMQVRDVNVLPTGIDVWVGESL